MRTILAILSIIAVVCIGCGSKGNNTPPAYAAPAAITDTKDQQSPMPPFPPEYGPGSWINAPAGFVSSLAGKVILVDFWDYTCINCIRTFPYLKEWHHRYAGNGFAMVGVHSPEFTFGKERANVEGAVQQYALPYPVVLDNEYRLWKSYGNHYWPATYIFDRNGILRYYHVGEGGYAETEQMIQKLLKEKDDDLKAQTVVQPVRPEDRPGAACVRPTPETYLGYERGIVANQGGYHMDAEASYTGVDEPAHDSVALRGSWKALASHIVPAGANAEFTLSYIGGEVNLVAKPDAATGTVEILVEQDGRPIDDELRGTDLTTDKSGNTIVKITGAKMYNLVRNNTVSRHVLTVRSAGKPFEAYVLTFTPICEM